MIRGALDKAEASLCSEHLLEQLAPPQKQEEQPASVPLKIEKPAPPLKKKKKPKNPNSPSRRNDRIEMNRLLEEWSAVSGTDLAKLKTQLRTHTNVFRFDYMTLGDVHKACIWLQKQIDKHDKPKGDQLTLPGFHD